MYAIEIINLVTKKLVYRRLTANEFEAFGDYYISCRKCSASETIYLLERKPKPPQPKSWELYDEVILSWYKWRDDDYRWNQIS